MENKITKKDAFLKAFSQILPIRKDAYVNSVSGFGGSNDSISLTSFSIPSYLLDHISLSNIYRFDWLARKYINVIAEDATNKFIKFVSDDTDIMEYINNQIDELDIKETFQEALINARLFGGAVIIVGAIDGQEITEPLNENNIREISYLTVLDRWQVHVAKTYSDPLDKNFGKPELYSLQALNRGSGYLNYFKHLFTHNQMIHSSRVIRLDGAYLPDHIKVGNDGWNDSVLINFELALKHYGVSIQSISALFEDFVLKILKVKELADKMGSDAGKAAIEGRASLFTQNASSIGIALIDKEDEDFEKKQSPVSGLDKLVDKIMEVTCGAAGGIPRARLFTQQMGKLAGAIEDTRRYYDSIANYQNKRLYNPIKRMLKLLLLDKSSPTHGRDPENWSFSFNSLWEPDDETRAKTRKTNAETDAIYIDRGVVMPEEITASRFPPTGYSDDTVIDWDLRKEYEKKEPGKEEENDND